MRRHLTPSLAISMIALFVALGGASYAAVKIPKNSVGNTQLRKDAVTSAKVKDRSLLATDFKTGQLPRGATGATGATGAAGASGVTAANGTSGSALGITLSGTPQEVMSTTVSSGPAGRMVVTGSFRMYNQTVAAGGSSCTVIIDGAPASQPTWTFGGVVQNVAEYIINNDWQVPVVASAAVTAGTHTASVVCTKVGPGTTVAYSGDLVAFVAAN
jgi:hypothetical protein